MKQNSPLQIAIFTAAISALGVAVIALVLMWKQEFLANRMLVISVLFLSAFVISFLTFYFALRDFIEHKIKIIYRNIYNLKRGSKGTLPPIEMGEDVFGDVDQEVATWARQSNEEIQNLKESAKFRREFIGNLSHELKTPVFNIQGYILTLLEGGLDDKQINEAYLKKASKNLNRLIALLDDLDMITRLESGEGYLDMQDVDLIDLVEEVISFLERNAKEKGINLYMDAQGVDQIKVRCDANKIHQVLTNLIVNSINYGSEGGYTKISFHDMDDHIMVDVKDDGIGIAKEHLPRLFERFYRIDKSRARHQGGSGLGLAIVKHIVDAHQQTISVSSDEGKGSRFSFTLQKA